jgi:hypothetical protein
MYSQTGKNLYKPQDSFIHKNKDTGLWDLNDKKFKPIISFVLRHLDQKLRFCPNITTPAIEGSVMFGVN